MSLFIWIGFWWAFQCKEWRLVRPHAIQPGVLTYLSHTGRSVDKEWRVVSLFFSWYVSDHFQGNLPDSQESDIHWEPTGSSSDHWVLTASVPVLACWDTLSSGTTRSTSFWGDFVNCSSISPLHSGGFKTLGNIDIFENLMCSLQNFPRNKKGT